jgi:hypothetical protein
MVMLAKKTDRFTETGNEQETVIMRIDSGEFFSLTGTAVVAWQLIDGTRDRTDIVAALASLFRADRARLEAETDEFLDQLKRWGLIVEQ